MKKTKGKTLKYRLIDVGRSKVSVTIEIPASYNPVEIEIAIIKAARKYLISRGVDVAGGPSNGTIFAGFHAVGRYQRVK